jgi:hypothetical protein
VERVSAQTAQPSLPQWRGPTARRTKAAARRPQQCTELANRPNPKSLIHNRRPATALCRPHRSTQSRSAIRTAAARSAVGRKPNPKPPAATSPAVGFPRHLRTSPAARSPLPSPAAHFASRQPTAAAPTRQAPVLHAHAATPTPPHRLSHRSTARVRRAGQRPPQSAKAPSTSRPEAL